MNFEQTTSPESEHKKYRFVVCNLQNEPVFDEYADSESEFREIFMEKVGEPYNPELYIKSTVNNETN